MSASGRLAGRCLFIAVAACAGLNSGCLVVPFVETTYVDPRLHLDSRTSFADPRYNDTEAGVPQAPFGYHQTQSQAFPMVQPELPKPVPGTPVRVPAQKIPEKKGEVPVPPSKPAMSGRFATPATTVIRAGDDVVPVPHPASVAGRTMPKNEKGFASLRTEPVAVEPRSTVVPVKAEPTPTMTRTPVVDPGIRQMGGDDEVMRPDWPKLPAPKK